MNYYACSLALSTLPVISHDRARTILSQSGLVYPAVGHDSGRLKEDSVRAIQFTDALLQHSIFGVRARGTGPLATQDCQLEGLHSSGLRSHVLAGIPGGVSLLRDSLRGVRTHIGSRGIYPCLYLADPDQFAGGPVTW